MRLRVSARATASSPDCRALRSSSRRACPRGTVSTADAATWPPRRDVLEQCRVPSRRRPRAGANRLPRARFPIVTTSPFRDVLFGTFGILKQEVAPASAVDGGAPGGKDEDGGSPSDAAAVLLEALQACPATHERLASLSAAGRPAAYALSDCLRARRPPARRAGIPVSRRPVRSGAGVIQALAGERTLTGMQRISNKTRSFHGRRPHVCSGAGGFGYDASLQNVSAGMAILAKGSTHPWHRTLIVIKGAREHNLKDIDVTIPARQARGHHGIVGFGQVQPGLRHHVRRRPAPLRGEPVQLRAPVPRPDEQAGP